MHKVDLSASGEKIKRKCAIISVKHSSENEALRLGKCTENTAHLTHVCDISNRQKAITLRKRRTVSALNQLKHCSARSI